MDMPIPRGISDFEPEGRIRYDSTSQVYSLLQPNSSTFYSFAPEDRIASEAGAIRFQKAMPDNLSAEFTIENPGSLLTYARRSDFDLTLNSDGTHRDSDRAFCILGVPTRIDDRPTQPIIDFTSFAFDGVIYDRRSGTAKVYDVDGGTATLRVDLNTGTVTSRLTLRGIDANGAHVEIGPIDYEAGIDASTAGFGGARLNPDPQEISQIRGGFFGPQGAEFGYIFNSSRYGGTDIGRFDLYYFGTVVGRR
nr:transferrin-binding protein-like solute binding protein [Novosphingobium album (ex Liu et al. 2023)]